MRYIEKQGMYPFPAAAVRRSWWRRRCAAAFSAVPLLAGCGPGTAPLRIAVEQELRTLDPHHHNDVVAWSLLGNFYDALVRFDPQMRLTPALATHWEHLAGDHLRLYLSPTAHFHDGSPVRAADVAASLLRARDNPGSRIRHLLEGVHAVIPLDETTVDVFTKGGSPTLLNRLALVFVVPRRDAALAEISSPVGSGPYRFVQQRSGGTIEAEAFASWRGQPSIPTVEFVFLPDEGERANSLLAGKVDVALRLSPAAAEVVERRPGRRLLLQPRTAVQVLELNPSHAAGRSRQALADPRVRRALLYATNRARYVNIAFRGGGAVASQYVHPVVFGFDPTVEEVPYDPRRAAALLSEAGVDAGGLALHLGFGAASADLAVLLAEDLRELGVHVQLQQVPFKYLVDRAAAPHLNARLFGRMCTTGDAAELFNATFHSPTVDGSYGNENYTGYADGETDALLEAADREMDPRRRLILLQRAQRRVLEAVPLLPLTISSSYTGVREGLELTLRYDQWLDVAAIRRR